MNISIRFLTDSDITSYRDLRLKSYQEAPFAFSESYEDEKNKSESEFLPELKTLGNPLEWFVLGAFLETGELIGFVKFRRDVRLKARHKSMIHAMYIKPEYRDHGIGKKLLLDLIERVKRINGLEQIHLWVLHSYKSASGFYKKIRFESQGTVVKRDLKIGDIYIDAEYMVMQLDSQ